MFEFLNDFDNYDTRCLGRFDADWGFISTARVSDGRQPYETAVAHTRYRDKGLMVIVEAYDTEEAAKVGHARWVTAMTTMPLPAALTDCANAGVCELAEMFGDDMRTVYPLRSELTPA